MADHLHRTKNSPYFQASVVQSHLETVDTSIHEVKTRVVCIEKHAKVESE